MNSCNDTHILIWVRSRIRTSTDQFICNSPWLFAAYHVLLRRLMPRHPPYALISLIVFLIPSTSSFRKRQVNFFRSWFLSWPLFSSSSYKTYLTRFLQQKLFMFLIHNTLLIYSYNIICFCFVIQLSMYVVCLLPDFWEQKKHTRLSALI